MGGVLNKERAIAEDDDLLIPRFYLVSGLFGDGCVTGQTQ